MQIAQPDDDDHNLLREVSIRPGLVRALPTTMRRLCSPFPFAPPFSSNYVMIRFGP
jgi:hypothetical protein